MSKHIKWSEVLGVILQPALDYGCEFQISRKDSAYYINLNTMAKSQCILKWESHKLTAHCRYEKVVDDIETFEDVLNVVYDCDHDRNYFSRCWLELFDEYGLPKYYWRT